MKALTKHPQQLLWLVLAIWGIASSQAAGQVLRYDFKSKTFTNPEVLGTLKKGDLYQVQIDGINPFLYKVSINNRDSTVSKPVTVPSLSLLGLGDLAGMVASLTPLGSVSGTSGSVQVPGIEKAAKRIVSGNFRFGKAMDDTLAENNLPIRMVDKAKLLIEAYQEVTRAHYTRLDILRNRVDSIMHRYNALLVVANVEFLPSPASGIYDVSGLTLEGLHSSLETVRTEMANLELEVRTKNENYLRDSKPYAKVIADTPELKAGDEKVKVVHTEFSSVLTKTKETLSADNLHKYKASVVAALNNTTRTYTSTQMQFTDEQTTLSLSITPRKEESFLQSHQAKLVFPLRFKEFWGVSSGFFLSSLYHEAYSNLQQVAAPGDTTYVIVSEAPGKVEFGINAMVRYGRLVKDNLSWQAGFGPGAAISDKIRPRLLLGTGLAWGDKHKLVFDIGAIMGFTDRLSKVYRLDGVYQERPERTTVSRVKVGAYFSIGYVFL